MDSFDSTLRLLAPVWDFVKAPLFYIGPFVLLWFLLRRLNSAWYEYKKVQAILGGDYVLLEIILPKEIHKSPVAMEAALSALNQPVDGNWWEHITKGKHRAWFSLEMVSIGGTVHFYIRAARVYKSLIESAIYSQYPDVEIRDTDDYVRLVPYPYKGDYDVWGMELELLKEDPYPIKTYVDYGLDNQAAKEETKTDPISATIEMLGSLGQGEFCFIQILVQATTNRYHVHHKWWEFWKDEKRGWKDEGKDLIKKLQGKDDHKPKEGIDVGALKLSPGELEVVKAVEKSLAKIGFDTGIRAMYIAKKENWSDAHKVGMINAFTQYNTLNLNGFKPGKTTGLPSTMLNSLLKSNTKKTEQQLKEAMFDAYRLRSYFYPPHGGHHVPLASKPFVLNTEELATVFHFPGGVTTTGGLPRIESKKGEAPPNLPI